MPTTIRLDAETERRLAMLAARTGRSKTALLREIVRRGIEDSEDYWLAADVLARVRAGQEKTHSAAAVRRVLPLTD
ncbi:ribbon-helix-helix protein, CopG family [Parvibaculum sp.]|uniref:type II toxin-antitoxin system RelB family antitoxin n=1 Tax=Parvibaculum sp. TaxID=2024848 RepID=UPI00272FFD39|nr:ribbon-helix-helix protein, CopG family [Parvibaculum sp.]MDP1625743.1 ribbon-helix-helix protein, CopG family [Parvibaculum sp.]MDP1775845.1 ribbon-helix-helix protein, CopG family [Moraxellaceae bacterium]MDP2149106.1 ribbon-helix-helix protein, CopG family [Parvibaculum sp.]MDP3328355.1 ribbon-helix-helix protein, CopG family [Parvibaculum sp.]